MKKVITKMLALTALVLFGAGNVNGQTYHTITDGEYIELSQTNIEASDWITYDAAKYSSRTKCNPAGANIPNLSSTDRAVVLYISGCESFTIQADGNSATRFLAYSINDGTAIQTAAWPNNCNEQTFDTGNSGNIKLTITGVESSVYLSGITFFAPSAPTISSFQIPYGDEKIAATIDNENSTISAELPYGTDLTNIEPVITLQGTAKSYSPTGAQDFSSPVTYSIYASENASGDALKTYTVTLTTEQAASTDATLSSITINNTAIEGFDASTTEYNVVLPYSATMPVVAATTTDVAASIATITQPTSLPATVTITVTAGDETTTKTYTVNISMETAPKVLKEAVFSNGFKAFIKQSVTSGDGTTDDSQGTVTAYYLAETTAPTVSTENLTCESGTATIDEDGNIVVTGEDNTTKTFTVSVEAVEPQAASNATITFNGTESWVKTGYSFSDSKGWAFAKATEEESNRRVSEGKSRIYFFVGACKEVTLTTASGVTSDRNITVAVNNVNIPDITTAPKTPGSITIPVNSTSPAMIEIVSAQTSGDGGFSSISIAPNSTTGLQQVAISSISFNGKQILNPEGLQVSVFDATGRMVINSNNTAISLSQGAYIVKAAQSTLKVIVAE